MPCGATCVRTVSGARVFLRAAGAGAAFRAANDRRGAARSSTPGVSLSALLASDICGHDSVAAAAAVAGGGGGGGGGGGAVEAAAASCCRWKRVGGGMTQTPPPRHILQHWSLVLEESKRARGSEWGAAVIRAPAVRGRTLTEAGVLLKPKVVVNWDRLCVGGVSWTPPPFHDVCCPWT